MSNNSDFALVISTCDLYEDAWNPFFRLLQKNWPGCPQKIYLITEEKTYTDPYFNVDCIQCKRPYWSDRMLFALEQIPEEYIWFFLEDFFLEDPVNEDIVNSAVDCVNSNPNVGVIRFIPEISKRWYGDQVFNTYFSLIPREYVQRSNLMLALYKKDYFRRMLRKKETPWDFERFGKHRSRIYDDDVLIQNADYPLAFPYDYATWKGIGITQRKWLKGTKELFEKHGIEVDFEKLGWYEPPIWDRMNKNQKISLIYKKPTEFYKFMKPRIVNHLRFIPHFFRNMKDYL